MNVELRKTKKETSQNDFDKWCISMVNDNRFNSYKSKILLDELTDPKLLNKHANSIKDDILIDIKKEYKEEFNIKNINKKLSREIFFKFKIYLKELNNISENFSIEQRTDNLENSYSKLNYEVNSIRNKLKKLNYKLKCMI